MNLNFNINMTSKQKEAYRLFKQKYTRYLICRWSRQSGKSVFAEIILIEYLCRPNLFNGYISPSFALGRKVFNEMMRVLEPTGIIKKANATTLTIESIFGSTLQFFSTEAYTSIRGNTISGVLILDEAAYYPDTLPNNESLWYNVIYPITKARRPKVLVISTPCGKQGFFFDMYNKALQKEQGYREITSTIYDDELITKEEIEHIKRNMPDLAFRQEYLVEFIDDAITFFKGFEICFKKFSYSNTLSQYIGIDLSGNGTDETILTKLNEIGQVRQYTIAGDFDSKYRQIADIINHTLMLQNVLVENNGLGAPMLNEIKKLVHKKDILQEWTTTNQSKEEIISQLAVDVQKKVLSFDEEDKQLYSQFGTFVSTYTKNHSLILAAKSGFHDDRILSLAIALKAKDTVKKPFNSNNYKFGSGGKENRLK